MSRGRASTPLIAAVMLMAGCAGAGGPRVDHDPLVGGGPPLPVPGAAAPVGVATNRGAAVPPVTNPLQLPPPTGATSPAALTVGSVQPGDSGLRIGPPGGTPPLTPGPDGGWHAQGVQPGVILKQPEPITDPTVRPIGVVGPPPLTPGGPPAAPMGPTWQDQYAQLQEMLVQRNVLFQSVEGPDEKGVWRFNCGVPSPDGPGRARRYEGSAVGDHGLAAIRAVIDKIDRDQQAAH